MEKTAVEWFYDKIKSHFEHDGDLFETSIFTYSIAKKKEKQQLIDFFMWFRDNGEKYLGLSIEKFVDEYYKQKLK